MADELSSVFVNKRVISCKLVFVLFQFYVSYISTEVKVNSEH